MSTVSVPAASGFWQYACQTLWYILTARMQSYKKTYHIPERTSLPIYESDDVMWRSGCLDL
jgi:hypothetical protein